jgi:hypothetical protein
LNLQDGVPAACRQSFQRDSDLVVFFPDAQFFSERTLDEAYRPPGREMLVQASRNIEKMETE